MYGAHLKFYLSTMMSLESCRSNVRVSYKLCYILNGTYVKKIVLLVAKGSFVYNVQKDTEN